MPNVYEQMQAGLKNAPIEYSQSLMRILRVLDVKPEDVISADLENGLEIVFKKDGKTYDIMLHIEDEHGWGV